MSTTPLPRPYRESFTSLLESLCSVSSPSGERPGLEAIGQLCSQELRNLGFQVSLEETPTGPILAARRPRALPPYTLLVGHLDTLLPARPSRYEHGRFYASGAVDMKGGIATMLTALRLLDNEQKSSPPHLAVLLVPDEETSGNATRRAMAEWGSKASVVLVAEPGDVVNGQETVVCGRKGLGEFVVRFAGRAAHSGLAFHEGRSALGAACAFIQRAEALSANGITVNVARLVAGDRTFVDDLATQHHLLASFNRLNVVPDVAVCLGEFRFPQMAQGEGVQAALAALAAEVAQQREVKVEFSANPLVSPVASQAGSWLAATVRRVATKLGMEIVVEENRGGISLANFLGRADLPVLDGLGPVGGGMHTEEEFVDLNSAFRRVLLLAGLLEELANQPPSTPTPPLIGP